MEAPRPRSHDVREGARGPVRTAVDQPRTGVTPGTSSRRPAPGTFTPSRRAHSPDEERALCARALAAEGSLVLAPR